MKSIYNWLKNNSLYFVVIVLIQLLTITHANAQVTACAGGVLPLGKTFTSMVPVPVPGHRSQGTWSSVPALTFTNPNDPNAIASGFAANTTYTITWTHQGRQKYVLTVVVGSTIATSATLLNSKVPPSTSDVVLCSAGNYGFSVQNNPSLSSYEFYVTHQLDGLSYIFRADANSRNATIQDQNNVNQTDRWANRDVVWAIATDNNGCKSMTNDIMISLMTGTVIQVQGGASVCQANVASLGLVLEVSPYDAPTFTYQWYRNSAAISGATASTYPITAIGDYYVVVSGCSTTYTSNIVSVTNNTLPTPTLSNNTICPYPAGSSVTINSTLSGGNIPAPYSYEWYYNSVKTSSLGTNSSATVTDDGSYMLRVSSPTDSQCHNDSPILNVVTEPAMSVATFSGLNGPLFCASDPAVSRTPNVVMNITGGISPYSVILAANGVNMAARSVTSGTSFSLNSITSNTTYSVVSIIDAAGCSMDPALFPSSITYTVLPAPIIQNLNTTTNVCFGSGVLVGLQNSEAGMTYILRGNVGGVISDIETITRAANGSFNFVTQPTAAGTYFVVAKNGSCSEVLMNGSRSIVQVPQIYNVGVLQPSPYCSGSNYNITLSNSETNVNYTLNGPSGAIQTIAGATGSVLTFNSVSAAGVYTITASNGACSVVSMNGTIIINSSPSVYNITGGNGCSVPGVTIGLSNSTAGLKYELFRNGTLVQTINSAPGGAFTFGGYTTAGTYTAVATNTTAGCSSSMSGSVVISDIPNDVSFVTTGQVCDYGTVALQTTQVNVSYQLQRDGVNVGAAILGTGAGISFGSQGTAGIYTIVAQNLLTGCSRTLSNSLEVQEYPTTYILSANKLSYCAGASPTGIVLTLSNSESNVVYQLFNTAGSYGGAISGATGAPLTWSNIPSGTYYVQAQTSAGCNSMMSGNITITTNSLPSATISVQGANGKCAGTVGTFTIAVALTGTPPYNFTILDDKGGSTPVIGWGTNLYTLSVNPLTTTTYTLSGITDNGGCSGTVSGAAIININPNPTVTITGATALCLGQTTTLTAAGAGAGGSYLWSTNANTAAITVAPTNTVTPTQYDVIATTSLGCSATASVNVTTHALPLVSFTGLANPATYCANDASVQLTGVPALGGFYNGTGISGTQFVPSMANIGANVITYTYTDGNGCTSTSPAQTAFVNAQPVVNILELPRNYCSSQGATTLTGIPTNASGVFSILNPGASWSDNNNGTATFNPSLSNPGTSYNVRYTYTDGNGCVNFIDEVATVIQDVSNGISITGINPPYCQNDNTNYTLRGQYNGVNVVGTFTGPATGFTDNNNGTATMNPSLMGNGAHTITFFYTDPITNCTGSRSYNVSIGTPLSTNITALYCNDDNNYYPLNGNPAGGTWDLFYPNGTALGTGIPDGTTNVWNPSISTLPIGVYQFKYTYFDIATNCNNTRIWNVTLVSDPDATFTTTSGNTKYCQNASSDILIPLQSGGFFSGTGVTGNVFDPVAAGVGHHIITYQIIGATCNSNFSLDLEVLAPPTIDISNINATYCDNESASIIQGSALGVPTGIGIFDSEKNASGVNLVTDNGDGTATLNPSVGKGTYWVSYTYTEPIPSNQCTNTIIKTVIVNAADPVNFGGLANSLTYCNNDNQVTLAASFSSGAPTGTGTYTISAAGLPAGAFVDNGDGTATLNPTVIPVGVYSITYTYTNNNGCITSRTKSVEIKSAPIKYNVLGGGHICSYDVTGLPISLSDTQTGVTYELLLDGATIGAGGVKLNGNDTPMSFPSQTTAGQYTVIATNNATGCTEVMNGYAAIEINNVTAAISSTDVSCLGGSDGTITITPSSAPGVSLPYQYTTDGGTTWSSSATFTGLVANTYQVNILDGIGCKITNNIPVVINQPSTALVISSVVTQDVGCLPCTVGGTCEGAATITVTGGTPFANAAIYPDGYDIRWFDSFNVRIATGLTLTKQAPGTYSVVVTDAKGCTVTQIVTIVAKVPLGITIDPDLTAHKDNICYGNFGGEFKVNATGGSGSYQFSTDGANWYSEVNPVDNNYTFKNLAANSYNVWVRDALNTRCVANLATPVVITEPTAITTTLLNKTDIDCHSNITGSFTVKASGGLTGIYSYSIDGVDYTNASGVFNALGAGVYIVSVKDQSGCLVSNLAPVVLSDPALLTATIKIDKQILCQGGSTGELTALVSGGDNNYSYEWTEAGNPAVVLATTSTVTHLIAGNYVVKVIDGKGCITTASVFLVDPTQKLSVVVDVQPASCATTNPADGSATLLVQNAVLPYASVWSSGQINKDFVNLSAGNYNVVVTDNNGCSEQVDFIVGTLSPIVPVLVASQDVTCHGGNNGEFEVTASGGSSSYEYSIDNSTWFTSGVFSNLTKGNYTVHVRDANHPSCTIILSNPVIVNEPAALSLSEVVASHHKVTCYGSHDGALEVLASGGSGLYEYSIDGGVTWAASSYFGSLYGGNYNIWVRDQLDHSCIYTGLPTINIAEPLPISFNYNPTDISCNGANDGQLILTASGGDLSSQFAYSIDGGVNWQLSPVFAGLLPQTYQLRIRDNQAGSSCVSQVQPATLTQPVAIGANLNSQTNVKCHGEATGSFTVTAIPSNASLQYSIDGGITWSGTPSFSGLTAGTYTVAVKNASCVNNSALSVLITEPANSLSINAFSSSDVTCSDNSTTGATSDGAASVTVVGGTLPYSFQWINTGNGNPVLSVDVAGTSTISNLTEGVYRVDVTEGNGCAISRLYTISQPIDWNVTHSSTNVTTSGGADGTIVINSISGATAPYQISWSDGAAYNGLSARNNLSAGTYTYSITDANGCVYRKDVVVYDNMALAVNVNHTDVKCFGAKTGQIDVTTGNGIPGYNVSWSGVTVTGATPSGNVLNIPVVYHLPNLEAGTYTISVTDNNGAGAVVSKVIVVSQPSSAISLNVNKTDITCYGAGDGTIDLRATGGTPDLTGNYTLAIVPGSTVQQSSYLFSNLNPGPYTAMAIDSEGCSISSGVTISEPLKLTVGFNQTDVDCSGAATGSLTAIVSGRSAGSSLQYDWYTVSGGVQSVYQPNGPSTINGLAAGTYRVVVTSGSCSAMADATIQQNTALNVLAQVSHVTTCQGDNSGKISLTLNGGVAPYLITYNLNGIPVTVLTLSLNYEIVNLPAGTYNLQIVDSKGCIFNVNNQVISEPALLSVTDVISNIDCSAIASGTLSFNIAGGNVASGNHRYAVTLSGPSGYSSAQILAPLSGAITSVNYSSLNEGDYTIQVRDLLSTDLNQCGKVIPFTLSHIKITGTVKQPTCKGLNDGSITNISITGVSSNYVATWSTADGTGLDLSTLPQAGLTEGTYTLSVSDITRGCIVKQDFVLATLRRPSIDAAVADVTCNGGNNGSITSIVVSDMTPTQYNWSGPGITNASSSQQLTLKAGTYQLDVSDAVGCMASKTFNVLEPTVIDYSLSTTLDDCDPHTRSIQMTTPTGGITTGGAYAFYWQGPDIVATTKDLTGILNEGLYTVTVSDDNNCQIVKSLYITEGIKLDTAVVRPTCFGGTNGSILVTATGGSGNFNYTWSRNGVVIPTETTAAISNIGAGTYRAVVTDLTESVSGVSCSQSIDIVINDKAPFVIDESITPISCNGDINGAINITVSGGTPSYQYLWSGAGVNASAEDQSGLKGGTYSVTITDQNGCKTSESYVITEPAALAFDLKVTQTTCAGISGELEVLNATGGTKLATTPFYNFQWAGPGVLPVNTTTTKVSNLIAGDYTVQMSDKNGCKLTKSATLYSAIEATYSVKPQTCSNMSDGQIDLTVSGGVAPYTYAWTTIDGGNLVAGAEDQSGLASGTYSVTISDSRTPACQLVINNIVVKMQLQLLVTGKVQPVLCFGNATGAIKLTVAGGIGTYSYVWSGPGITSQPADPLNVTGLIKGNYQVVVTNNTSGCQEMKQFTVDGPDALLAIDNITTTNVLCNGNTTGEIHVSAVGGTPYGTSPNEFYKYLWTGPIWLDSIANQVNLPAGNYTVRVKDGNGCLSDVTSVVVSEPAQPISISLEEIINVTVTGSSTGVIEIASAGGSGSHSYSWEKCTSTGTFISTLPSTGTRIDNLSAGFYRVTVTDDNGCSLVSDIYPITEPGSPLTIVLNILKDIRPCNGDANGELAVNITGGTPDMSSGTAQYEIKFYRDGVLLSTSQGTSLSRNDLLEGSYEITATDANGIKATMQQFVNEPSVLELTYDLQQNVSCYNGTDGWIRVYLRGGKPNSANRYQLSISGPEGSKMVTVPVGYYTFTDLSAGLHRIDLIDDANGDGLFISNGADEEDCHKVLSDINVTQPEAHVVLSGDAIICDGDQTTLQLLTTNWSNIASNPLRVTLSNGIVLNVNASPYFFVYTPTSSEFLEITSVTVGNCQKGTYSGSATLDFKARPDARVVGNATICSGETTPLTFYFDGVAPWSVTYNNGSADIVVNNIQTSPYVVNVNPSVNTTYTVKSVSDKYCTTVFTPASSKATVVVNSLPTATISGNATICEGQSTNLTFTLTGKAPWQVTYVADGVEQTIPDIMSSPYVVAVKPLHSASFVLKHVLDANGCEQNVSGSVLVTVKPQPDDPGAVTGSLEVCQGELGVKYSIAAVTNDPGNTYVWTLPAGFIITSGAGSTAITLDVGKSAVNGVIKVAVVNACGTSSLSSEIYVTVNPLPNKPAPIVGPVQVCQSATGIIYSIPATTNATSYVWSVPAGFNIVNGQGTTTIQVDLDPSQASVSGNITVTAVNDCGLGVVSDNLLVGIDPLPAVFAGTDENICSTSYIMKATNPGANFTGTWSVKSGAAVFSTPGANNSIVTNIAKGENVFVWTVRNNLTGCISSDEVKITNNQLVVSASANLYESCSGGAVVYGTAIESGDTKTTGLWTFANSSTGVFSNAAANQTAVSNLSSGSVILRWTLTRNGCASSADVAVLNNKPAQASIVNKLAVADRCVDNVQLIAQAIEANSSGRWNVISGSGVFDKPLSTTVNVTGLMKDTVNKFSWTVSRGGCSVVDYVSVRNNQITWSAGTDQTVCSDYTSLSGQIPKTELKNNVLWTVTKGNGSFANAMDARTRVDNLAFGENKFRWAISKNGCISDDTVSVFSYKPSKATILTGNLSNCADTAVIEAVVPNPLNGLGYWGVTSGSGQIDALTASKTIVRGLKKGDNTLRWSVTSNGCTDYSEIKVTNKLVDVDAGRDFSSCSNIVKLGATAAPTGTTGGWSVVSNMGSGLFDPNNSTPTATVYGISSLRDANNDMLRGNVFVWTITKDGCQSTDTVIVTYNGKDTNPSQSFTAGNDVDINLSNYTMSASPLNKGEVGTWTIISGGGNFKDVHSPTTVVSSLVQGANVFRWTVSYNGCSWSDEVTVVNGQVTPANAGLNQTVCEDVVTLHANEPNGVGKGEWSIVQGSGDFVNKSDPQTKVRYLGAGDNIFRWTISYNGSSASKDEVTITNNMPQTANAGVDDMTCSDWYQLSGNDPSGRGVATWSIINGGGSLGVQAPSMRVTNLSQGINIFKYEINNKGCISIDSVKIINGLPTAPNAGTDRTICTDSVQLTPNNPTFGTGEWRIAEGFAQTPMTNNWAKKLAPGVNKFVWVITTDYQCILTDTVTITSHKPTTSFAGYNQDICGDTAKLLGNNPEGKGIGTWYRITGAGSIDNPLNANTIVRSLGRGSNRFRWVIDNNGCTSSSDVEVVNNLIVADAGFAQTLCADTAIISGNTAYPGVGTWGVLSGSQGAKFDNPDKAYTVVRHLDRGENILTWTINYKGCKSTSKVSITNNMPTAANAGPNVKTCNDYVTLSAGAVSQGTGSWTIRNGGGTFDDLNSPTANVTKLTVGSNIFRWTTEYKGCSSTDDIEVTANTIKAIVGPDQPNLCSNTTTLQANSAAPGVGTWSVNGGGVSQATFEDVNNPNTVVSNLGKGKNTLRWTIINEGCPSFAELVVVNNSPSASYAGNSQEVCDAQVVLDATEVPAGTGVGHWEVLTGAAKISDLNNAKATVTGLSQGDNVFRWSVVNGTCIDNDEVLIVNNKPSTPYAGNDEELCSTGYQLKAGVPEFGSGNWSIFKGSGTIDKPNSPETSIANVGYDENVFIWTITQGQCQLTDSVKLINNTPTKAQAGPDIQDCKSTIELDANIPVQGLGTGFWTLISGKGAFKDATYAKTEVYDLGFGENILQWTITKGNCFSSDQISVFNKIPDQALAGSDRTICDNYVVLNANNPVSGTGSWSILSGQGEFEDKTRFDTKVKSVGFGTNQYKWTIAYGECVTEDVVVVTSNKAYPYAGEDDIVYKPNYSLKASNPGDLKGQWTLLGGGGDFENSSFFNTSVSNLNEGVNTYRWTIDVNGCIAYDDVSITYKLVPDAGFIVDTTKGCYPLTVQFTNYSLGGTVYNWDFGDGNTSTERNPKHIYTDEGEFSAVLTIPGPDGHDDVFSQRISVYGHPKAEFNVSPSTVYIPGESIRCYNLTNDARSYVWDFGDGTTSTEPTPMHEYMNEGVYDISLTAINQYGCEDVFYINSAVEAIKQGFIVFPNAFAPRPDVSNGVEQPNGVNEVFRPKYKDIDTYHLQIFDRWGQLIYESDDITLGWDGTYKNNPSAQDVYVFKAWGTFISGKEFRVTGNVLLVK